MTSSSNDTSSSLNYGMDAKVVGSRSIGCMCNLLIS